MNSYLSRKGNVGTARVSSSSFIISNKYSFRMVRRVHLRAEIAEIEEPVVAKKALPAKAIMKAVRMPKTPKADKKAEKKDAQAQLDEQKRVFLRLAGVAGLGVMAASILPKKADAYILGSGGSGGGGATSGVVGVKNASDVRIDPATETTLAAIKAQSDLLTFDSGSNPANLKVNIAAGTVGVRNATDTRINPATEDTLALIKLQTSKLQFDVSNNLLTSVGGTGNIVGVKDTSGTQVNPATDDSLVYLRRMVKLMESQATVDAGNRQRVVVDSFGSVVTGVGASGAGVPRVTVSTDSAFSTTITSFLGANDQAFQDVARNTYANGIRANLQFA